MGWRWRGWNLYSQFRVEVKRWNSGEEEVELNRVMGRVLKNAVLY